ncbi:MAG: hypothetical protein Sapg2KO_49370 [Saprospiraceae bacterium]
MQFDSLDKFGAFFIQNLLDKGLESFFALANNQLNSPSTEEIRNNYQKFTPDQQALIEKIVIKVLLSAKHDFLFALQKKYDSKNDIQFLIDGVEVAKLSDGLHGELFSEDGWIKQFSAYADLIDL